ncbi:MAG: 2-hydroxyhepta-2,4-diene,7-dioate isomerase, partial [Mucilaginibacter sp.]|nr:2-hydroxyhepta-2,4-diene,7-dioate isomerase [Mucilaginibacter sp.]
MKLYNTKSGIVLDYHDAMYVIDEPWDLLINRDDLADFLLSEIKTAKLL